MYLIYVDEYGTSGGPLDNPKEPYFSLTASLVNEKNWNALEADILQLQRKAIDVFHENGLALTERFEFHAAEMLQGKKLFKGFPIQQQIHFAEELLKIPPLHGVHYATVACQKMILADALSQTISILSDNLEESDLKPIETVLRARVSPYGISFCMMLIAVNIWLTENNDYGVFIFDEHTQYGKFAKLSSYSINRLEDSSMSRILAAPFFTDSKVHTPLQLSDMVGYLMGRRDVAKLQGRNVQPPIINEWLASYSTPYTLKITENLKGSEFSAMILNILEEMWPAEFEDSTLNVILRIATKSLVDGITLAKNIGDETPEGLAPVT